MFVVAVLLAFVGRERDTLQKNLAREHATIAQLRRAGDVHVSYEPQTARLFGLIPVGHGPQASQLEFVSVRDCQDSDLRLISQLNGLTELKVVMPGASDRALGELANMKRLEDVHIEMPGLKGAGMKYLRRLPELRRLKYLCATETGLREVASLNRLTALEASGQFGDRGMSYIGQLHELEWLHINSDAVSDDSLAYISTLDKLRYLAIDVYDLSDDCLRHLVMLKDLTYLYLPSPRITHAGVAELRRALPNAAIVAYPVSERDDEPDKTACGQNKL
jgi:hypothetical protein